MKRKNSKKTLEFFDNATLNNLTYYDYFNRLKKVCLSIFEWVNLPNSMNARAIEQSLFYKGQCAFLKDENYGFINTNCADSGKINIYNLPTELCCYSNEYTSQRRVYTRTTWNN